MDGIQSIPLAMVLSRDTAVPQMNAENNTSKLKTSCWFNSWHTCANKGTSGFTSNTLLIPKQDQFTDFS